MNIRSILSSDKMEELKITLQQQEANILGLKESWGNETIADTEMSFPAYVLFRRDRTNKDKVKIGGVLLYV